VEVDLWWPLRGSKDYFFIGKFRNFSDGIIKNTVLILANLLLIKRLEPPHKPHSCVTQRQIKNPTILTPTKKTFVKIPPKIHTSSKGGLEAPKLKMGPIA
jgi:hypothetical protein